jgi:hypothetical protein
MVRIANDYYVATLGGSPLGQFLNFGNKGACRVDNASRSALQVSLYRGCNAVRANHGRNFRTSLGWRAYGCDATGFETLHLLRVMD